MLNGYTLMLPDGRSKVVDITAEHPEGRVREVVDVGLRLQASYDSGWLAPPISAEPPTETDPALREAFVLGNADRHGFGFIDVETRRRVVVGIKLDGNAEFGEALPVPAPADGGELGGAL